MINHKLTSTLLLIGLSLMLMAELCVSQLPVSLPTETPSPAPATPSPTPAMPLDSSPPPVEPTSTSPASVIREISLNTDDYPNGQIPQYSKLEITFQVDTTATSLQLPFDAAPPPGVQPGMGISVDALFTPDNWRTVYHQPAFYYQEFLSVGAAGMDLPQRQIFVEVRFT
jgi:hypothetical protein